MELSQLQEKYIKFIEERDWQKFHQPKNVAMALSVEASELMELFQWKDNVAIEKIKDDEELMENIRGELADVTLYAMSLAHHLDIDLEQAVNDKLDHIHDRYDKETAEEMTEELEEWRRE